MFANLLVSMLAVAICSAPIANGVSYDLETSTPAGYSAGYVASDLDDNRLSYGSYNGRQVKNAYYDSGEAYDTTPAKLTNYCSANILWISPDDQFVIGSPAPLAPQANVGLIIGGGEVYVLGSQQWMAFGDLQGGDEFTSDQLEAKLIDVYINGELAQLSFNEDYDFPCYFLADLGSSFTDVPYIWVFDHQEVAYDSSVLGDITEIVTGGIVNVATGLGNGIQHLVQDLFLVGTTDAETGAFTATGLSTFGIVIIVFAGLALCLGLSRWILNFVSSLGARDR